MGANGRNSPKKIKVPADVNNPPFYLPLKSLSRYKLVSNLGNGSFGSVQLAKSTVDLYDVSKFTAFNNTLMERTEKFNNENHFNKKVGLVAIKTMTKKLNLINDYAKIKEIRFILSIPYHLNLVQMYEMFIDNRDYKLHIVMECLDQNLYQLMKARRYNNFSQTTLRSILSQILNGIRHIHKCEYFHRDIKPENILVTPSNRFYDQNYINSSNFKYHDSFIVKIADYGLARHVDNKRPYTSYVSTRWYRSPEILLRKNWYSKPVDIWAFGSVACEVATFRPLFPGSDELDQIWKVFDVLGTPYSKNPLPNYYPSYGYWDEVQTLSSQLKLEFSRVQQSVDISFFLPSPELAPLCDVIRACLTWDPNTRATVDDLCSMPYFKGTCVDDSPTLPLPIPVPAHLKSSKNNILTEAVGNSYVSKAGILAGIPNMQNNGLSKGKLVDTGKSWNDSTNIIDNKITKLSNQVSGTNESFVTKCLDDQASSDPFTLDLDTQENLVNSSNDENQNAFNNNGFHNVNNISQNFTYTSYNSTKPRTTLKPSTDDYNLLHYTGGNNMYPFSPNIDPNYVYNPHNNQHHNHQQGQQIHFNYTHGDLFTNSNDLVSIKPNTIDENFSHNSPKNNNRQYGVDGSSLNIDEIIDTPIDEIEDKLLFQGTTTNGSIQGLYPNDYQQNQRNDNAEVGNDSTHSNLPLFTGELLSKFNLRRTNNEVSTDSSFPDIQDPYDVYQ
ncbi:hypothetical protein BN7_5121 [Wickerhamomyces ciferrii]|uniref:Protein kinase domain-containing protein n=1 Tax=Wickerhamomyces ciferrii (strain ATCC 14091 / BCRC 22168 / CBS 111 / JCM 3599 / NBRC 0793 / NRRL Y-1031 F-60-10) TaxID=1206466 RepID=K0KVN1_WICCF|nr:uncharacterized protein BN7_5121 [Wickerhamomyces ciferrii]CCH45539.1 hypothetical protein BN7_5121 [Wickerhamomyces ciferrii]